MPTRSTRRCSVAAFDAGESRRPTSRWFFAVFGVLGFGWRSWLQYRRTGSTGFRGISGGSTEWIAGVGFVVALIVAASAPIMQWVNIIGPIPILGTVWIQAAGIVVATAGIAATVADPVHPAADRGGTGAAPQLPDSLRAPLSVAMSQSMLLPAVVALVGMVAALFMVGCTASGIARTDVHAREQLNLNNFGPIHLPWPLPH
jgi:hypothetical protein